MSSDASNRNDAEASDRRFRLSRSDQEVLRRVALESIQRGLETGQALEPDPESVSEALRAPGAAFVTLNREGRLRGCIGSLEARYPLVQDVAQNAYSAAFMDFRFPPLTREELPGLELHISFLTPLEPFEVADRDELTRRLRPGLDGLLLEDTPHRATFLPQVWEVLQDPEDFVGELFLKAGLPRDHWSSSVRCFRYGVQEF